MTFDYTNDADTLSGLMVRLAEAASDVRPVSAYTHTYYRYPARFSNHFVREAIEGFSRPGDVVLDPFLGGGTTAVEALAQGRRAIGTDVSALAQFVSIAKTTPLGPRQEIAVASKLERLFEHFDLKGIPGADAEQHLRSVPWQLRRTIAFARARLLRISSTPVRMFATCVLLRTAQWALDNRKEIPSTSRFRERLLELSNEMLASNGAFRERVRSFGWPHDAISRVRVIRRCAAQDLTREILPLDWGPIRLVLTSPPYLGVHVLYHRWQVRGRRETAAPFWLAGLEDNPASATYTFVERRNRAIGRYFHLVEQSFAAVARCLRSGTPLIQLVSFSRPDEHLESYLNAIVAAGFEPCDAYTRAIGAEPRWRTVPSRRWYNYLAQESASSREVLLVHRRKTR